MAKAPAISLLLQKRKASDKSGVICLVVYPDNSRVKVRKSTGYKIEARYWDDELQEVKRSYPGMHPDYNAINREIKSQKEEIKKRLDEDLANGITIFSAEHLKSRLNDNSGGDFMQFFSDYITNLEATKKKAKGTIAIWNVELNTLKLFAGDSLDFKAITTTLLNKYHAWLIGKNYLPTTIFKKLKKLRQIIRRAIDAGLIDTKQVATFEMVKYQKPETTYLTLEQVKEIENNLHDGKYDHNENRRLVAAFFLVECYSGIRFSDWGKFRVEKLVDKNSFKVGETTKTKSPVYLDLTVFTSLARIIEYIQVNKLVFNLSEKTTNEHLKVIGGMLSLTFDLSTHDGRRTFATILHAKGARLSFIARAMSVSERTAAGYVHHTRQADEHDLNVLRGKGGF